MALKNYKGRSKALSRPSSRAYRPPFWYLSLFFLCPGSSQSFLETAVSFSPASPTPFFVDGKRLSLTEEAHAEGEEKEGRCRDGTKGKMGGKEALLSR